MLALLLLAASLEAQFLERYFDVHPTRATQAGSPGHDGELEDLSPPRVSAWLAYLDGLERAARSSTPATDDERIDREVLLFALHSEQLTLRDRDATHRNPLFWTGILADAAIDFLLREDRPMAERIAALESRARAVPRLARQARMALSRTKPGDLAPELVQAATDQARALAELYGQGLGRFAPALEASGRSAGASVAELAAFLSALPAHGTARLWSRYREVFRIGLRVDDAPEVLLPRFEDDLRAVRASAAAEGRALWPRFVPGRPPPSDDKALLRDLFAAIESDHDTEIATYVQEWQEQIPQLERLARAVITLPDPLTLRVLPAPPYLEGQAYGGVFPAGPYRPDGQTLLLLPVPPSSAGPQQRGEFFRAFNRPFSRMIAAHEVMPGHYVQLKIAAHQGHPIRAVFPDLVYAEGWGTFAERLMLDQGWGGPAERIAHWKKQLENCARAIVDIRVHALGASREDVDRIVRDEALQDPQLAANLWRRTLTTSPQLVTYHLGYRQIDALYREAKTKAGFDVKAFSDLLMSRGAIPLRHYEAR